MAATGGGGSEQGSRIILIVCRSVITFSVLANIQHNLSPHTYFARGKTRSSSANDRACITQTSW